MITPRNLAAATAVLASLTLAGTASAADNVSLTFDQRGEHEFVVPAGVTSLRVEAVGEQGGGGKRDGGTSLWGGYGGDVSGRVFVTPGRSYWIEVGVGGGKGGDGQLPGGDGGGASVFRVCRSTDTFCKGFGSVPQSRLIVAGGGGGTAGGFATTYGKGGNAGMPGATSEPIVRDEWLSHGGAAGTESLGGAGGTGLNGNGLDGQLALGGDGALGYFASGGGGGGGYYGGGGGGGSSPSLAMSGGGGGGGANHYGPSVQDPDVKPATVSEPSVTLTWFDDVAPEPSVTLAPNSVLGAHPTLVGKAGTAPGDAGDVTLSLSAANGPTVKAIVPRDSNGDWTYQPDALAPGTYEAAVSQGDWAHNFGRSGVTFRVEGPAATPAPSATPQAGTPATPAAPASLPKPAVAAPIRIASARLVHGTLGVRLKCAGPAGKRCSGRLKLTAKAGKRTVTLASAPYAMTSGKTSTVRLHVRRPLPRRVTVAAGTAARTITVR
jgi:hypothetical protein